jgi:hypothetical protein
MGQQRYIMSAVLILLFVFLLIGTFNKIPDWKIPKSDIVEIKMILDYIHWEEWGRKK